MNHEPAPLPHDRPQRVLVIGGGHPQLALIEALATIDTLDITVIDDRADCPAWRHTNHVIDLNRYDLDGIRRFASTANIDRTASAGADRAVHIAAIIAAELGLPHPLDPTVTIRPMTKGATVDTLTANGVRCPHSVTGTDLADFDLDQLSYPVVVKPDQGIGQTAVNRAHDRNEARTSIEAALAASDNNRAVVQEYIEGEEVGINGLVTNGTFQLLTVAHRRSSRQRGGGFGVAMTKVYPAITDTTTLTTIEQTLQHTTDTLGITNAPIYAQAIHTPDNDLVMIEAMPRLGGGEDPRLVHKATGIDLALATAYQALQIPFDLKDCQTAKPHQGVALAFLQAQPGTITKITTPNPLPPGVTIDLYANIGDTVEPLTSSRQRLGYVLTATNNPETAHKTANDIANHTTITTET